MAALSAFNKFVLPNVSGCPTPVAEQAILESSIDFCQRARVHRDELDPVAITAGTATYTPSAPSGTVIASILWSSLDGNELTAVTRQQLEHDVISWRTAYGTPSFITMDTIRDVRLVPIPTSTTMRGKFTLTGQPADTETVVVGTKTYTFQTTLTDSDGNVAIGSTTAGSISNLINAINLGGVAGTAYAASMTAQTEGIAAAEVNNETAMTVTVSDLSSYPATTETVTNGSWQFTTMSTHVMNLEVYLKPSAAATSINDDIFEEWHEAIAAGALSRLFGMARKSWTSAALADMYGKAFEQGILDAASRADSGYIRPKRKIRYGGI